MTARLLGGRVVRFLSLAVLLSVVSSMAEAAQQSGIEGEQEEPPTATRYPGLAELFEETRIAVSATRRGRDYW